MRKKIWCVFLLVVFLLMAFFMNSVNAAYDDYYNSYTDSYSNDDYYKNAYYSDNRENIVDYDIEIPQKKQYKENPNKLMHLLTLPLGYAIYLKWKSDKNKML